MDTPIPSYISNHDVLLYLARVPGVQPSRVIIDPTLCPGGFPLVAYEDSDGDDDFDIKEIQGPLQATPPKRRARKMKEPLDPKFCISAFTPVLILVAFATSKVPRLLKTTPPSTPPPWRSFPLAI